MKIVFITSGTVKSSISYRTVAMGKELVKNGHDVYIIAPKFDKYSNFKDFKIKEIDGIKILRPIQPKFLPFELGLIPYIISALFILHKLKPDFIHIYKANPITLIGLVLRFSIRKKVIFDTDDIDSEVMKIENNPKIKIKLVRASEKLLLKYSHAITTGSQYLQRKYSKKFKHKLVAHIPNGAEFVSLKKITKNISSKNKIVFIGNINRINILKPLFIALKDLKKQKIDVYSVIIGDGLFLDYFKNLSTEFNLNKSVTFLGKIPQNELHNYVSIGDLGYSYMPNEIVQKACSNMKVFQYMQFGAAPIVSNVGDLPIYTFRGKAGYIAKHSNVNSLVETLKDAIINKKLRMEKITFALENSKNKYCWSVLARTLNDVYQKII